MWLALKLTLMHVYVEQEGFFQTRLRACYIFDTIHFINLLPLPTTLMPSSVFVCSSQARTFLVMELCPNGDLQGAAQDPDHSLANRKMWILQVYIYIYIYI